MVLQAVATTSLKTEPLPAAQSALRQLSGKFSYKSLADLHLRLSRGVTEWVCIKSQDVLNASCNPCIGLELKPNGGLAPHNAV